MENYIEHRATKCSWIYRYMLASRYGHLDIAKFLIENGANVDATSTDCCTALLRLLLDNDASCIKTIERMRETDISGFYDHAFAGSNALHLVVNYGDKETTGLILQYEIEIDAKIEKGDTALHMAARHGHIEQVRLLMEYGACMESKNIRGETAIVLAAVRGHDEIVRILGDRQNSSEEYKPWLKVARIARAIELDDQLLARMLLGDDENDLWSVTDSSIWGVVYGPLLHLAVSKGNEEVVALLLEKGADVEMPISRQRMLKEKDLYILQRWKGQNLCN
ncbi:ankyrin repeat-containing protein, putative [Talaromyces stipitatus ATCC 10500]|uniref:Ankyrin repeat-containing protein, putative n=1 Tax=Talaromyces stipitatus (strain ATCC 10500 / CBS 375.48 / QM 6759 / NRRL 1006) TaxID=441959 RepID=B8MK88_TALSN|nr:ankyrin repeat-containing protein, putative [Talaromyces stipitatus ATCC 10500]EED15243.1 ankyrin repeat-containing protein, putative [Talaromyces stipitatus ATCC 10500]